MFVDWIYRPTSLREDVTELSQKLCSEILANLVVKLLHAYLHETEDQVLEQAELGRVLSDVLRGRYISDRDDNVALQMLADVPASIESGMDALNLPLSSHVSSFEGLDICSWTGYLWCLQIISALHRKIKDFHVIFLELSHAARRSSERLLKSLFWDAHIQCKPWDAKYYFLPGNRIPDIITHECIPDPWFSINHEGFVSTNRLIKATMDESFEKSQFFPQKVRVRDYKWWKQFFDLHAGNGFDPSQSGGEFTEHSAFAFEIFLSERWFVPLREVWKPYTWYLDQTVRDACTELRWSEPWMRGPSHELAVNRW